MVSNCEPKWMKSKEKRIESSLNYVGSYSVVTQKLVFYRYFIKYFNKKNSTVSIDIIFNRSRGIFLFRLIFSSNFIFWPFFLVVWQPSIVIQANQHVCVCECSIVVTHFSCFATIFFSKPHHAGTEGERAREKNATHPLSSRFLRKEIIFSGLLRNAAIDRIQNRQCRKCPDVVREKFHC